MDETGLGGLSPDFLVLLGTLFFSQTPPSTTAVRERMAGFFRERILDKSMSYEELKSALGVLAAQGLVTRDEAYGGAVWHVSEPVGLGTVKSMENIAPGKLRRLTAVLDGDFFTTYGLELGELVQKLLLSVVSGASSRTDEAWRYLDRSVERFLVSGDFLYGSGPVSRLGLAVRLSLGSGAWESFTPRHQGWAASVLAYHAVLSGAPLADLPDLVLSRTKDPQAVRAARDWKTVSALVGGQFSEAVASARAGEPTATARGALVLGSLLTGDEPGALAGLDALLADLTADRGSKQETFVPGPLFPWLACLALARDRAQAPKVKSWATENAPLFGPASQVLWSVFRHHGKAGAPDLVLADFQKIHGTNLLDNLLMSIGLGWAGGPQEPSAGESSLVRCFKDQGAGWYAAEGRPDRTGLRVADLVGESASWEAALKRLADLKFDKAPGAKTGESGDVLCWLVDPSRATVDPVFRKVLRSGDWSAPKPAPMTRLLKGDHPAIQADDRPALKALATGYYGWDLDHKKALEALPGHPRLFLADHPDTPLTLEAVEVELKVDEEADGLVFSFSAPLGGDTASLIKVGPAHWQVLVVSEKLRKVAEVVGPGLVLPPQARSRVVEVLGSLAAGVQVRSPLLKENDQAVSVHASEVPVVLLTPNGLGISAEVHVRPLGPGTPFLRPGEGPELVHARTEKKLLTATRDLASERRALGDLLAGAPDLDVGLGGGWSLAVPGPVEALGILAELRDAGSKVEVEWPRGGKIGLHRRVGSKSMKITLTADHQWFSAVGQVTVDNGLVVELKQLVAQGALGRFVRLADGDWVELEAQLVRQLEHLGTVSEPTAKGLRIALTAMASSDLLLDETVTRGTAEIDKWREKWKAGISPDLSLPATLTAELRPYQVDGFRWLVRLAEVGAGACLADDMGLGKTVQAIALLAHRAAEGPSLVVAPTSVAPNWVSEIRRFDRHLDPVLFSDGTRADRQALVAGLRPGQVLVVTYGLLVTEEDLFTGRDWNTVVLDEAQAVKNAQTKRSQVVLNLRAGFRLAATGTPLQNHLGELWTLFEFLNPGLLGTKTSFQVRYWIPIEDRGDPAARRALQTLVRPFLLRRTKNQVLTELPDRTETTLAVDLTPGERAFYEALRQKAVESLTAVSGRKPGEQQILMLTHLMKLRRACCHPALAGGPGAPTSSKLDQLEELLEGLLDNGHQVLVFSQFTDHLALIRERLESRDWAYEYLDGSTPSRDRADRVARFQAGSAPVFLISLQAGGTGLNLTAADYVVHMDPWWNPAVEDQASDRAHRLGQTRPVTIYRLVAKDTIEQRIVDLHRTKRDLAEALLEGTEAAGRLGTEELMALVTGGTS